MRAIVTISGVSSFVIVSKSGLAQPRRFQRLTSWSVLSLEELASDHACNVRPAVYTHDNTPCPFPRRVPCNPDGEQWTTDEYACHAHMCKAITKLCVGRCGHHNETDDSQAHTKNGMHRAFSEVIAGVYDNE